MYELAGERTRLVVDEAGTLAALEFAGNCWLEAPTSLWELVLQEPCDHSVLGRRHELAAADATLEVTAEGDTIRLCWRQPTRNRRAYAVTVTGEITFRDDEYVFRFTARCDEPGMTLREFRGPILPLWLDPSQPPALLWPSGAGERITDPTGVGLLELPFPTRLCMAWLAFDAGERGLYIGSHDASLATRMFRVDATEQRGRVLVSTNGYPFADAGT